MRKVYSVPYYAAAAIKVFMKFLCYIALMFNFAPSASAINPGEHYATNAIVSPNRQFLIETNVCCWKANGGEAREMPFEEKSTLWSLPLSTTPGKELIAGDYKWSPNSAYFITNWWDSEKDAYGYLPAYQYKIRGYDTAGAMIEVPGYGASPAFSLLGESIILYSSEFTDEGQPTAPQLFEFNFNSKTRKLLAVFPDTFTFWPIVTDLAEERIQVPAPITDMWGGKRGLLHKKEPEQGEENKYTFLVPWTTNPDSVWKGKKLIIWKGDYTSSLAMPKPPPVLEEK